MHASSVLVQFSFSNRKRIPAGTPQKTKETQQQGVERVMNSVRDAPATRIFHPTERCDVRHLADQLYDAGYQPVSYCYQVRHHRDRLGTTYYMVRWVFLPVGKLSDLPEEIRLQHPDMEDALLSLLEGSLWQATAFVNPTETGEFLSFNFNCPAEGAPARLLAVGKDLSVDVPRAA